MQVIVKVLCNYFEPDTSKYRLAISDLTLIESLKRQTDKQFTVIADMSAMDPRYTKRIKAFQRIGVPLTPSVPAHMPRVDNVTPADPPYIEVHVDDDTFIHKDMIQVLRRVETPIYNRRLLCPNGYLFLNGKIHVWNERPDMMEINQIVDPLSPVRDTRVLHNLPTWIHVRHSRNNDILFDEPKWHAVSGLNWPGWKPGLLDKYCEMKIVEATAQGSELHPTKSKSVVYAGGGSAMRSKNRK